MALASAHHELPRAWAGLDPLERERARRLRPGPTRERWVVARASVRVLLADELCCRPGDVRLTRECAWCGSVSHGKPRVTGRAAPLFSVSRSGPWLMVVLSRSGAVGADLEVLGQRLAASLPGRVLAGAERARLATLPARRRGDDLLRRWVVKEAYMKYLGTGLAVDPRVVCADEIIDAGRARRVPSPAGTVAALAAGPGAPDPVVHEVVDAAAVLSGAV